MFQTTNQKLFAMENGPFIDVLPLKIVIFHRFLRMFSRYPSCDHHPTGVHGWFNSAPVECVGAPYLVAAVALGVNPTNAARAPETPGTATAVRRIVSAILSGNITNNHLGKNEY